MWPISAAAQQALTRSHQVSVRATAYTPDGGVYPDLPISGGTITVDAGAQVRRTCALEVADPQLWPAHPADVLSPLGSEIAVEYGVHVARGGVDWVPVGRFVTTDGDRSFPATTGPLTFAAADRVAQVADSKFGAPVQTSPSRTVVQEITHLIHEVTGPGVPVIDRTGDTRACPRIEIQTERWADGVATLAKGIGAEVFADPVGRFVVRPVPAPTGEPDLRVRGGPGGLLLSAQESASREQVFNEVHAYSTRSEGTVVRATVRDDDPGSPTRYRPGFQRSRRYGSPVLMTTAQCAAAARSILDRVMGHESSWTLTCLPHPGIDAGDRLDVAVRGDHRLHVVETTTLDLGVTGAQTITTRSRELPPEEEYET